MLYIHGHSSNNIWIYFKCLIHFINFKRAKVKKNCIGVLVMQWKYWTWLLTNSIPQILIIFIYAFIIFCSVHNILILSIVETFTHPQDTKKRNGWLPTRSKPDKVRAALRYSYHIILSPLHHYWLLFLWFSTQTWPWVPITTTHALPLFVILLTRLINIEIYIAFIYMNECMQSFSIYDIAYGTSHINFAKT